MRVIIPTSSGLGGVKIVRVPDLPGADGGFQELLESLFLN